MARKRSLINVGDNQQKRMRDKLDGKYGSNSFTDSLNRVVIQERNPRTGNKSTLVDTTNLIVYHGRHWLMQRAFAQDMGVGGVQNQDQTEGVTARQGYRNKYISWLGIGNGANALAQSPLDVEHPALSNYGLREQGMIYLQSDSGNPTVNYGSGNVEYGGVWGNDDYKQFHSFDSGYPKFIPDVDVVSSEDSARIEEYDNIEKNDTNGNPLYAYTWPYESVQYKLDSYLVTHIRTTIGEEECNGPLYYDINYSQPSTYYNEDFTPSDNPVVDPTSAPYHNYQDINEAGLFMAPYFANLTGISISDANRPEMFARVTFPTIRKRDDRELIFNWFCYF